MVIVDNVISEDYQEYIKKLLLSSPWYLKQSLDESTEFDDKEQFVDVPGWANVSFYQQPYPGKSGITNPHVDIDDENHLVCLYYVMDADGDTVFFDKRNDVENSIRPSFKNYNIIKSVTPKQGRCILSNGRQYDATTLPQKGPRCVINFNLGGSGEFIS